MQSPGLEIMSLLVRNGDLETDYVSVLDLALGNGETQIHEFDYARFEFLGKGYQISTSRW